MIVAKSATERGLRNSGLPAWRAEKRRHSPNPRGFERFGGPQGSSMGEKSASNQSPGTQPHLEARSGRGGIG